MPKAIYTTSTNAVKLQCKGFSANFGVVHQGIMIANVHSISQSVVQATRLCQITVAT
jgi:hypothetical protein